MRDLVTKLENAFVSAKIDLPKVLDLKKIYFIATMLVLISFPLVATIPIAAQTQRKAVILSSLENLAPMGIYRNLIAGQLQRSGYDVTFLAGKSVTIDFLLNRLNNYAVVIWRTNLYNYNHANYWYVGEWDNPTTEQKYASDFAAGWINANAGILGVNMDFFSNHLSSGSLGNVKLAILESSMSNVLAPFLIDAGIRSAIYCNGLITLTFGTMDDLTGLLMNYLVSGQDVSDAIYNTVSPFNNAQPNDQLDTSYAPPFWFIGDSTLTIA